MAELPPPPEGSVLAHFIVSEGDWSRARQPSSAPAEEDE
jgi:hypothetical protein